MPKPYLLKNIQGITDSSGSNKTSHKIHRLNYRKEEGTLIPIIYKENKKGNPEASIKEISFSELARLFMLPNSTPQYHLVKDGEKNTVTGVASHYIQLSIAQQVTIQTTQFKKINFSADSNEYQFKDVTIDKPVDIPCQFLNELPPGFFSYLMAEKNKGALTIDMDSLASALAGKYTLEEDDLHKGNIGIYTIIKNKKCHVVFFNLDHDLMLSDSITSFLEIRPSNWSYGKKAFNITASDLINFPDLKESRNHYWPTYKRLIAPFGTDKAYTLEEERAAFRDLKNDPEFNHYKWKRFLKAILISNELMQSSLTLHFNPDNPRDASEINLITQAMNERTIKLRAVLLSIPEFHTYLTSEQGKNDFQDIKQEIQSYMKESYPGENELIAKIQDKITKQADLYLQLCNPKSKTFVRQGDTSLHISIRLGEYRFDESQKAFSDYVNTPDKKRQLPIDVAADMAKSYKIGAEKTEPGKDPFAIIKHLLSNGAVMTPKVTEVLKSRGINIQKYHFQSKYYERKANNYVDLRVIVTEIGQDNYLSLKTKKIITVNVIKQHLKTLSTREIEQLKEDLNGAKNKPIAPEFLFISQLRSNLWIVRAIRGLYGNSSTKKELNKLINNSEMRLTKENRHKFFSAKSSTANPVNTPLAQEEESSKIQNKSL